MAQLRALPNGRISLIISNCLLNVVSQTSALSKRIYLVCLFNPDKYETHTAAIIIIIIPLTFSAGWGWLLRRPMDYCLPYRLRNSEPLFYDFSLCGFVTLWYH